MTHLEHQATVAEVHVRLFKAIACSTPTKVDLRMLSAHLDDFVAYAVGTQWSGLRRCAVHYTLASDLHREALYLCSVLLFHILHQAHTYRSSITNPRIALRDVWLLQAISAIEGFAC